MQRFYRWFNSLFNRGRSRYLQVSLGFIRKSAWVVAGLAVIACLAILLAKRLPTAFVPEEDQGYAFAVAQLPSAASLDWTDVVAKQIENILTNTPGVKYYTTVEGFSLLSQVIATYNAFFFVTLKPWSQRTQPAEQFEAIRAHLNAELGKLPGAIAFGPVCELLAFRVGGEESA